MSILVFTDFGEVVVEEGVSWDYVGTYLEVKDNDDEELAAFKNWNGVRKV